MPSPKGPAVFRILLAAKDLPRSRRFFTSLLGVRGRNVADGRVYFDCGSVILGVLDRSGDDPGAWSPPAEAVYFATGDLEGLYERARRLGCLSSELLHGDPASPLGKIAVRPWGERSFYVQDPSGNSMCFVDRRTLFTGTPHQVTTLHRATRSRRGPTPKS
jgi:catechol 2,3-dioxygenase-like lactoylglutathione lyase family enzyme